MSEKLKVAILGYGKMGKVYADCFQRNPHCSVTAVYNHSVARKAEVKEGLPEAIYYSNWQEMLETADVDIVGLCTPTNERIQQIYKAYAADMHILCEMPICLDLDELKEIQALIKDGCKHFRAASELKYHPVILKVSEMIQDMGDIFFIDMHYSMYRTEIKWKHTYRAGGGVLRELGQHLLDVASMWLGTPVKVYGRNKVILEGREVEDLSVTTVDFENGAVINLIDHYFDRSSSTYKGMVYGTGGQVFFELSSYDVSQSKIIVYNNDGSCKRLSFQQPEYIDRIYPGHMDSFKKEIDLFVEDILSDKNPKNSLMDVEKKHADTLRVV